MQNDLNKIIEGCLRGKRKSQRKLYELFYDFAWTVCRKYAGNREETEEIINNGFLKIFKHLNDYDTSLKFENWARRIFINTAIDYYRKNKNYREWEGADQAGTERLQIFDPTVIQKMSADEILACTEQLPPSYRLVFNLYVVEGYSHREIAEKLNITTGSSKSALSKAREKLKLLIGGSYDN